MENSLYHDLPCFTGSPTLWHADISAEASNRIGIMFYVAMNILPLH